MGVFETGNEVGLKDGRNVTGILISLSPERRLNARSIMSYKINTGYIGRKY
jgi:hypothetical protein